MLVDGYVWCWQAGIRDGIEFGKEDTLQQGFDQGFSVGAVSSYRFSVLRGALRCAILLVTGWC